MKMSIVVVNFNGAKLTLDCVASIRAHAPSFSHEVIVVDNKSTDTEREELKRNLSDCTLVLSDRNLGFGGANNLGAARASGELVFFLNNDTIITSDIFTPLTTTLERNPNMGLIGPALRNQDGTFQVSFGRFPSLMNEWQTIRLNARLNREIVSRVGAVEEQMRDWITGAAMMVRKECFNALGGFDESYFMYFEDVDLCYRARRLGHEIGYAADCSLIHLGGMSYSSGEPLIQKEYRRSQLRFYDKFRAWPERLMLRFYLLIKACSRLIAASDKRTSAALVGLVFKLHGK
jgi:hypothetical protein